MRLINPSAPDLVELRGRDTVRAPVWVGLGLLLGPGTLSLLGPAPFTPLHVGGLGLLLGLALALIALGWPKRRWVRVRTAPPSIATSEDAERPLHGDLTVRLMAVPTIGSSGNALYGVGLEEDGRGSTLLIASEDPGDALTDLASLRKRLPLRVVGGWGLGSGAPWIDLPARERHAPAPVAPWDDRAARRPIALTLLIGAVVIAVAMAFEIRGREALGDAVAPLSVQLPVLGLGLLLTVTLVLATHGVRLALGKELTCERRVFGLTYARKAIETKTIRGAYLVSPSGHHARHLLLDTESGPVAFPCDDVTGTKMASALARGTAQAR